MKLNKKLNQFSYNDLIAIVENYNKYVDFNTLGLFRAIVEHERLDLSQKIALRDKAIAVFSKFYNFLQIKDPTTYFKLQTLGQDLTKADIDAFYEQIRENQYKILRQKRIKHRNFGIYSKHGCGYEDCNLNDLMVKQKSWFKEREMYFVQESNHARRRSSRNYEKYKMRKAPQILKDDIL
jgi:hypothetical protein